MHHKILRFCSAERKKLSKEFTVVSEILNDQFIKWKIKPTNRLIINQNNDLLQAWLMLLWLLCNHHENIQLRRVSPPLAIWKTAFQPKVFSSRRQTAQCFPSFPSSLLSLSVLGEVWVCAVCKHALIRACAHACMSEQFDFSLCMRAKRTWRHVPFLSCPSSVQPRQGLSRARIKGAREEEKVLPQLIWPLWGEEHYSHWCSGRMAETPRSFRKGAYSRLDVTRRTGLEDGCWAHCGDGGNIVPAPLL